MNIVVLKGLLFRGNVESTQDLKRNGLYFFKCHIHTHVLKGLSCIIQDKVAMRIINLGLVLAHKIRHFRHQLLGHQMAHTGLIEKFIAVPDFFG